MASDTRAGLLCVQSWGPILTHVKRKRQQVDKCYSHMKTEWISRLNVFSGGWADGPAELHCSTSSATLTTP